MTLEQLSLDHAAEQERKKAQKAEQARINGAKSKGPTTAEGKARSSRNGIRHGMTANEHTVLEAESLEEYDEVRSAFIDQLKPATKAELRLVEKIANLDWRLERLAMMETSLLNLRADLSLDEINKKYTRMDGIGIVVLSWLETTTPSGASDLLRRYMTTLQSQYNSTYANFRAMKKDRLAEAMAGDTFPHIVYEEPKFDNLAKSEIEAPPPSYDEQFAKQEKEAEPEVAPLRTEPTPSVQDPAALPTEPTNQAKIHSIPKRPAA